MLGQNNECTTVGGNDIGVTCKFPFVYNMLDDFPYVPATMIRWFSTEQRFENCTDYRKKTGRSWCATRVTSNDRYIHGHWGECPDTYNCNTVEGKFSTEPAMFKKIIQLKSDNENNYYIA